MDELLGNATGLPITEHATDTHGATLVNFGLFDLVGKALTPRIRDLGKITLLRDDTPTAICTTPSRGTIVRPHLQDQTEQAWCLTLLTNAVITWTTEYYGIAIGQLRDQGREIGDDLLSFIAPGHRENINFFGFINVDIEAELAKLIEGWRPLRPTAVNESGTTFMLQP